MLIDLGDGRRPSVPESSFVAPNATLAGSVVLGEGSSVWFSAVLRADNEPITIGRDSNVQDGCAFHVAKGHPVVLGENVSVGHNAVVHGATIEDGCLIGMGAVVMNGAVIGRESLVAAGAVVTEGVKVPPRSLVAGVPGKVRRELTDEEVAELYRNASTYTEHRELFQRSTLLD